MPWFRDVGAGRGRKRNMEKGEVRILRAGTTFFNSANKEINVSKRLTSI